jgi:tRNA (uracil-5-)-methyltransferase TRM9
MRAHQNSHSAAPAEPGVPETAAAVEVPDATTVANPSLSDDNSSATHNAAAAFEQRHVHDVYAAIAPHFSATRHSPWPLVQTFLDAQPAGSLGLDIGCGNGKYAGLNPAIALLGCDFSEELVGLAMGKIQADSHRPGGDVGKAKPKREASAASLPVADDALVADSLDLPFRANAADFAISIAVVHHFSTRERRIAAVREVLRCVRPGGQVLLYVWALEQRQSRRGWDEGQAQDQFVPWVVQRQGKKGKGPAESQDSDKVADEGDRTFQRYYHLYRRGELEEDVTTAGGLAVKSGYEKDNWWVVAQPVSKAGQHRIT